MTNQQQWIAFYTLVRRELVRMYRIASQVFLPPVITTVLYFLIFGTVMGSRIGTIHGFDYTMFIAPGLIIMFSVRFQKSIEEILVSPMSDSLLLLGYVMGGILRGVIVAILVFLVAFFFLGFELNNLLLSFFVVFLISAIFALAGFTNGMVARTFDDIALVPTFILTPMTYLGGVFYSISMLSPFWQAVSKFNPIVYMINAMRHAMIGGAEVSMGLCMTVIVGLLIGFIALNLLLLKRGIGFRD